MTLTNPFSHPNGHSRADNPRANTERNLKTHQFRYQQLHKSKAFVSGLIGIEFKAGSPCLKAEVSRIDALGLGTQGHRQRASSIQSLQQSYVILFISNFCRHWLSVLGYRIPGILCLRALQAQSAEKGFDKIGT